MTSIFSVLWRFSKMKLAYFMTVGCWFKYLFKRHNEIRDRFKSFIGNVDGLAYDVAAVIGLSLIETEDLTL